MTEEVTEVSRRDRESYHVLCGIGALLAHPVRLEQGEQADPRYHVVRGSFLRTVSYL